MPSTSMGRGKRLEVPVPVSVLAIVKPLVGEPFDFFSAVSKLCNDRNLVGYAVMLVMSVASSSQVSFLPFQAGERLVSCVANQVGGDTLFFYVVTATTDGGENIYCAVLGVEQPVRGDEEEKARIYIRPCSYSEYARYAAAEAHDIIVRLEQTVRA